MVAELNAALDTMMEECFTWVTKKYKSSDAPWISINLKDNIEKRKRLYASQNKSDSWRRMKKNNEKDVRKAKKDYLEKAKQQLMAERSHALPYNAIKRLKNANQPTHWDIRELFFSKISKKEKKK